MDWKAVWSRFRNTVYFRIVYLFIIVALIVLLFPTGLACIAYLLSPILMVLIPHSFGERRLKSHAVNGVFVFLMVPVVYAMIATPGLVSAPQVDQGAAASGTTIVGGNVDPFTAPADTLFQFRVNVNSSHANRSNFQVVIQIVDFPGIDTSPPRFVTMEAQGDRELNNSEDFLANVTLRPMLHAFNFRVTNNATGAIIVETVGVVGPFNAPYETYLGTVWVRFNIPMLIVLMGFGLILMLYWWTRRARELRGGRAPPRRKRAEGGGEFTCTNCGADVSEQDVKCPNCGAEFGSEAQGGSAEAKA